jgi:hypothetical protein
LDLQTPSQPCKLIDSDIQTEKDKHFRHSNQQRLDIQTNKDKLIDLQIPTQPCKQIHPDIQTEKDMHFRHSIQQSQILGLANTNPDKQTNKFRHTKRERHAL